MKDTLEPEKSSPRSKKPALPRKITLSYLENAGKFYLEKFPASVAHFRQVMGRKIRKSCLAHPDQPEAECLKHLETVITRFIEAGLLNDTALSHGLLYSFSQRGWSQRKIRMRLQQKGLPADLIDMAVAEAPPQQLSDLESAAVLIRRKRLGPYATRTDRPDKWMASLGRAGFDYETARRALALSQDEIEDLISGRMRA